MASPGLKVRRASDPCGRSSSRDGMRPPPAGLSTSTPNGSTFATVASMTSSAPALLRGGGCCRAFIDRDTFMSLTFPDGADSLESTRTRTVSPTDTTSCGLATRPCASSETCTRPRTPPRSTNAPYGFMESMIPSSSAPSSSWSGEGAGLTLAFLGKESAARQDHRAPAIANLEHLEEVTLAHKYLEVRHVHQIHLARGAKRSHFPDLDLKPALHRGAHRALDRSAGLGGQLQRCCVDARATHTHHNQRPLRIIGIGHCAVDAIAHRDRDLAFVVGELVSRDAALRLLPDVHEHELRTDHDHRALHTLTPCVAVCE